MSRFAILLGGEITRTGRLLGQLAESRVIAADSGIAHAAPLGLGVELWVGDFDSAGPELQAAHAGVPREVFPADKDRTDGEIAIAAALARGASELVLVGSMGGRRTDHALGHVALALRYGRRGVPLLLTSGAEEAWPIIAGKPLSIDLPEGSDFSIIPFSDLGGLSMTGVRWPLEAADVELGSTWTLSNRAAGGPVRVSLASGYAIALAGVAP